jgi:hypothetical protein
MWHVRDTGKVHKRFWWGILRETGYLKDIRVDGRIILKWIFNTWDEDMNWIGLAQYRNRWGGSCE